MKKLNKNFFIALSTILFLTGCMPDSLTKFKKDDPKKSNSSDKSVPSLVDSEGNPVSPGQILYPTKFYFISDGPTPKVELPVGTPVDLPAVANGSLGDPNLGGVLFLRCELVTDVAAGTTSTILPPGLRFNQADCNILGTPTQIYSNNGIPYQYTAQIYYKGANYRGAGTESSLKAHIKIGVYQAPTNLTMTQTDKLQVVLNPTGGDLEDIESNSDINVSYSRYGILTSSDRTSGVVKYVDSISGTVGLSRTQAITLDTVASIGFNEFVVTSAGNKRGKIVSVNTSAKTIYVEPLVSGTVFLQNDQIQFVPTSATVFSVRHAFVQTSTDTATPLMVDDKLDNDKEYFSERFRITKITQTFQTLKALDISPLAFPTLTMENGIKYSISPALPNGLTFDVNTGKISGQFLNTKSSTAYTITAANSLGSTSTLIHVAAINPPKDLSYTSRQLITVNSNASFVEGENLFQAKVVPLTTSVKGRILRKVSTDKLSIETFNGKFLAQASLDSGNAYYNEKNYIKAGSAPNYYNLALTVSSTASFTAGVQTTATYLGSSSGAKGRVVYVDNINNVIYVQFLTPNVVSSVPTLLVSTTFAEGDSIDNVFPYVANKATIVQVEATNMELTINAATTFTSGSDFTSNSGSSGYVYEHEYDPALPETKIKVNEINRTSSNYLRRTQLISNGESFTGPSVTLAGVTHDNLITFERGSLGVLNAQVSQGTSLTYSISPALPPGLTLNALTGEISGTPTTLSLKKSYVVTAINLLDKIYYAFDLEVSDYFTFSESSGAKSFLTHKVGSNRTHRPCRINSLDIINENSDALDIGCDIEAEELELMNTKLKMKASVGGGVCDYVAFKPFSFWQYEPVKTSRSITHIANGCTGGPVGVTEKPTAENSCYGNYSNDGGPNCDTGTVTVSTYSSEAMGDACSGPVTTTIFCGGTKTACLAGPITSVITDPIKLEKGDRMEILFSAEGAEKTWELKSSFEFNDITNLRNANGLTKNSCTSSTADRDAWANRSNASILAPHDNESPFYEFTCRDAATEVKARIRLTVREWNLAFKINEMIDTLNPPKMNSNAMNLGSSVNNYRDWDDNYTGVGAAAGLPTCGAAPVASCSNAAFTTPRKCEENGATWSTTGFRFPEDNL